MKERPILFSGAMVRAILDGRKTVTRRIVRFPRKEPHTFWGAAYPHPSGIGWLFADHPLDAGLIAAVSKGRTGTLCPYGAPGDRLWVRETWATLTNNGIRTVYRADGEDPRTGWDDVPPERRPRMTWRPSIFMRREESRLTLDVVSVRVERLQDITEEDARAEGFSLEPMPARINGEPGQVWVFDPVTWFAKTWDTINADRATWLSNPWVWRVEFRRRP